MNRRTQLVIVGVIALTLVFFFAPFVEYTNGFPPTGNDPHFYRSLGCSTIGLGVIYSWFGLKLGCVVPPEDFLQ